VALTRRNALFAGSDGGGRSRAIIASLIATARLNNVEPFAYLRDIVARLVAGHPANRHDELLPWTMPRSDRPRANVSEVSEAALRPGATVMITRPALMLAVACCTAGCTGIEHERVDDGVFDVTGYVVSANDRDLDR
jgi:hypothetical protein